MRRNRKVPFNCYLSVDQLDALDRVSERERRPRAEIVREAVEHYLAGRVETPLSKDEPGDGGGPESRAVYEQGTGSESAPEPAP